MAGPDEIYGSMLDDARKLRLQLLKNARHFSITRFLSFFFFLAFTLAAFTSSILWWIPAVALLFLFVALVILHEKSASRLKFNDCCIVALTNETEAINGHYGSFDGGGEFSDPTHINTTDLDVFGHGSIFQAINRTATLSGKGRLADWLKMPLHSKNEIASRQEAVIELAAMPEWRIKLRAHGMVVMEERRDLELLYDWLRSEPLFQSVFFAVARVLIPLASFAATALFISGIFTAQLFLLYLILPLAVTGFHTRAVNRRHAMLSKKVELLQKYSIRFRMIEEMGFKSACMARLVKKLKSGSQPASSGIHRLGRITASLDTRLNILAGFVLNIFLLWDIRQMSRLEKWQIEHKESLPIWFDVLADAEAIASLGAFSYANPGFVFPEITTDQFVIIAENAGHPLIPATYRVNNSISVTHRGHFNIVTGANMAGKSTYLRTIGVNMLLALAGAPVCAVSFICYPATVYTSLRTTDSLSSNQSYFYAELLRLKELIDRLNRNEELFVLLDEILKGTNSADKQAGSKALLTQLIGLGAAGFIATHDLELGNLEKLFPGDIRNYSFEAEITGEELHFSYKLKDGIARNMNATFLMKKMGITL
jgi:hypothetical protein